VTGFICEGLDVCRIAVEKVIGRTANIATVGAGLMTFLNQSCRGFGITFFKTGVLIKTADKK